MGLGKIIWNQIKLLQLRFVLMSCTNWDKEQCSYNLAFKNPYFMTGSPHCVVWLQSYCPALTISPILLLHSWFASLFYFSSPNNHDFLNPADWPDLCRNPVRAQRLQLRGWGLWVISWGCCSVPEGSPGRRWGWRSAGSWLCGPHPPSSFGSPPLSAAASPA